MNDLLSYLLAQAQRRPLATARFAAGEALRRSRLRRVDGLDTGLPLFPSEELFNQLAIFCPMDSAQSGQLAQAFPDAETSVCNAAENICRHEFEIFGDRVKTGTDIDWHADWVARHRWPLAPPAQLRIVDAAPGADIKRPWELARFHHGRTLARAFFFTQEPRFAEEFAAQVRAWIRHNPFPRGIHWAMPMEASIRGVNWVHAAALFCSEENPFEPSFCTELLRSLFLHGRFVFAHREWNPVARGNHYLSCVVGLLHLGALFSRYPEGARWLEFARRELSREMRQQVGNDGAAHEGSSGYHTFLTELFLHSALLLARIDSSSETPQPISRRALEKSCGHFFTARLESMFTFLAALTAGRERPPVLGDSDDGRLLPCCSVNAAPAHHLLAIGAELLARHDWPTHHACEEVFWALGTPSHSKTNSSAAGANSSAFRKAGFFFFASERIRGSIRCGPLGVKGWANHAHCDQLSVEFCFDGRPMLVDPGTYLYSGDAQARNEFRSSRAHNSVVVAGAEQNRFWPGLLFRMIDDTRSRPRAWRAGPQFVEFHGEHFGYRRLRHRVKVARGVRLDRRKHALEIFDYLTGSGSATLEWHFHFAPSIEVAPMLIDNLLTQTKSAEPWGAAVMVKGATPEMGIRAQWKVGPLRLTISTDHVEDFESALESGWISSRYSHREKAPVLVLRCRAKFPAVAEFLFEPIEKS